jgi:isopenicillin N synthase-like dioxygenase
MSIGESEMIPYTPATVPKFVPVIDLSDSFSSNAEGAKGVAWEIHKACRETGFFYVVNHRVPAALLESQFDFARRFFALPIEHKLALQMKNSPGQAGYEPIGGQTLDSQDLDSEQAPPDLKESFYCGMELAPDHPWTQRKIRGFGHNQWPALSGFRDQMLAYQDAMRRLGDHILGMLALSLELPQSYFAPFYDMPLTTLRLLRYPLHPVSAEANQLGAGAHTDWGGITLLLQDDLGGLEVRNIADEWIEAKPIPGTFVINLGDLMQRWTNGLYHSNMHRVKNNSSTRDRYSIPYFYSPRPDAVIECLPSCADAENKSKFPPCTANEHISEMFRRSYGYMPA